MAFTRGFDNGLVFGTTVEAIREYPTIEASIDPQALFNYAYFHEIPSPQTIYQDILKLQSGEYLMFSDGRLTIESYWHPTFIDAQIELLVIQRDSGGTANDRPVFSPVRVFLQR